VLKTYLHKAGKRTIPRLRRRIGTCARNLTARDATNYHDMREIVRCVFVISLGERFEVKLNKTAKG
jgi:hypothetical protein